MSKYTTEVRYICEQALGQDFSSGYNRINDILQEAAPKIFDFDFPIFDENYRLPLEKKILKHYYTREIGAESVGLWKLWLDQRLNEIMPFYNKLYESELIKFNPLYDTDLTTDHNSEFNGSTIGNTNTTDASGGTVTKTINTDRSGTESEETDRTREASTILDQDEAGTESFDSQVDQETEDSREHWQYYSDTPQGGINGLSANTYLTNATHDTDEGDASSSTTTDNDTATTKSIDAETTEDSSEEITRERTEGETIDTTEKTYDSRSGDSSTSARTNILNTEDYIEHVIGKRNGMSYSRMLIEFRETFLNIDLDIINNLNDLFLNLW